MKPNFKRITSALILCGLFGGGFTLSRGHATAEGDLPFHVNGQSYKSQKEFVESGRRCSTRTPSEEEVNNSNAHVKNFRAQAPNRSAPGSVVIPVYFHLIRNSAGQG